jgi:hypothetical protein
MGTIYRSGEELKNQEEELTMAYLLPNLFKTDLRGDLKTLNLNRYVGEKNT